jgi:hypothetical protein
VRILAGDVVGRRSGKGTARRILNEIVVLRRQARPEAVRTPAAFVNIAGDNRIF